MSERVHFSQTGQKRRLVAFFVAWKCLLLVITLSSPGPGYDTSSLILVNPSEHRHSKLTSRPWLDRIALNLFRWDSFYFIKTAQRGYVHEQEWAFSWVYSAILKKAVTSLSGVADPSLLHFVWAGVAVSNISHLVSVLILFKLSNVLLGNTQGSSTSLIACILHILSPAGLFLIAPYSEALFAALNFGGMLCYVQARVAAHSSKSWTVHQDAGILSSAVLFGLATWIRGNGLLSGLVFLFDVASAAPSIVRMQPRPNDLRRVIVTFVAGVLLGTMYVFPQYIAYREYCSNKEGSEARPWCHRAIPSIYTWVQGEYWNVGFLRYWTVPNLPLFLIAAPMLWLLVQSSVTFSHASTQQPLGKLHRSLSSGKDDSRPFGTKTCQLPQLVLPQLVLAIAATTSFHVQIINRISSGYPIWYMTVAQWLTTRETVQSTDKKATTSQLVVRGMIVYSIVQGVLFAGFLPPA